MKQRRWLLRVPLALGWLGLPASCIVFEPLEDVADYQSSGAQASTDGGAESGAPHQATNSGGQGAETGGDSGGSGLSEAGMSSGGAGGVSSGNGGAPESGGTSNAANGGRAGVSGTSGGTVNATAGNSTGGANACAHTCGGRFSEDFEACSYPRETSEAQTKTTLGCPRKAEDGRAQVLFACQLGLNRPCTIDWKIREIEAQPTRHAVCFWGNDSNETATPLISFHVRADDFTGATGITYRYCSNEALRTMVSCGVPSDNCSDKDTGAPFTIDDDDSDATNCGVWQTATVPFDDTTFTAEKRASANLIMLQTMPRAASSDNGVENFKVCIDEISLY